MTREPKNGLPRETKVYITGGMLVVEFPFADIGDRAVALTAIEELKFNQYPMKRQPPEVQDNDYLGNNEIGFCANPNAVGSIDVVLKAHEKTAESYSDITCSRNRNFFFSGTRRMWETILLRKGEGTAFEYLSTPEGPGTALPVTAKAGATPPSKADKANAVKRLRDNE